MRATFAALYLVCAIAVGVGGAQAQSSPVVVELFTSQGCSSCPPADALLHELAAREDVIALALHVDYWDYIGWADVFASPAFTRRQQGYAVMAGAHMVYTPQMVIGGIDHVAGADRPAVLQQLRRHAEAVSDVRLDLRREGGVVVIGAEAGTVQPMVVQLVRYLPEQTVNIGAGENLGRQISYANIVTSWEVLTRWSGQAPLALRTDPAGDEPVVVIIQAEGPGAVLAAARLD